ncbi:MAG: isoleucine--tRNA ligase [Rhodospirillaceae bacterium]|nr:isoleucine--tRNA ligase [Rhodospirillaceae bacterium]|tara:strand:- start:284 stop:3082 length:2799 start_codon:yes stop_codon:yes gene_type:complete
MTIDYKDTIFLPATSFPMRAGLPKREPEILAEWERIGLEGRLRDSRRGKPKFILHDGPPYANGHLHMGHALNKVLKDVINRSQQMLGKDSNYVPGWDCHGLPIEWKIEEDYRERGLDKDSVPILEFRKQCRDFAEEWIKIQTAEFKRLGVTGTWDNPYTTMSYKAEAQISRELGKFLMNGGLYKGSKPVLWSVVEKTALADAEVEYHDHNSTTIHVRFPVLETPHSGLKDAAVIIWTTTPWTIPGNRAVAYGEDFDYALYEVMEIEEDSTAVVGEKILVAVELAESAKSAAKIVDMKKLHEFKGSEFENTLLAHPLRKLGYDFMVPMLPASFVTLEQGSGFVHIAPGAGADDFELGLKHNLEVVTNVDDAGKFYDHIPLVAGMDVLKDNYEIAMIVREAGSLLAVGRLTHSYPHSWRSKAPLIFRTTPQWFISMEKNNLREIALDSIDSTRFIPDRGKNRLKTMIEQRPDWCVSRQRAWGVPITIFVEKSTGEPLRDQEVIDRIADIFEAEGSDAWYSSESQRFLGKNYDAKDFEKITDIVEVWFDSGSTHSFVLEARPELQWPASLYLEGSDQHRGWFHTSLLESSGTRGRAPFEAVLTHGFVLDEGGRKMSKSMGNVTAPQDVIGRNGADILRLWVVGSDYSEDLRIGPEILKRQVDLYRRLRNTLRYVIGNLNGFNEEERIDIADMPELEKWVLHRLSELDLMIRRSIDDFDFHNLFQQLHNFCSVDLSAFYFDIRKDALYCDSVTSVRRRSTRTILDLLFNCLTTWLAPILCFTAEEAWQARVEDSENSVHLQNFMDIPQSWSNEELAKKWNIIRDVRRVVTGALELERAEKRIGSSLQAKPTVFIQEAAIEAFGNLEAADIFITSGAILTKGAGPENAFRLLDVPGVSVVQGFAEGEKCERCWKILPEVGSNEFSVCRRCRDAIDKN